MKTISTLLLSFILLITQLSAQTTAFSYTGGPQTYTVPAGINIITVNVRGAQGANASGQSSAGANGGGGGSVQCKMAVTPGQTLYIYVGGSGSGDLPGYHGGAFGTQGSATGSNGNTIYFSGGGGGGASEIAMNTFDNTKVIAGGGGGGGAAIASGAPGGAGGGVVGQSGGGITGPTDEYSGKGGTQSNGGAGGSISGAGAGFALPGTRLNGGWGASAAGGGGGGYYGGGGGGSMANVGLVFSAAGGGGGSSWADALLATEVVMTQGDKTGDGSVTITPFVPIVQVPPTVSTQAATNIYSNVAQLNAFVDDKGAATTIAFEYSTSPTMVTVIGTLPATAPNLAAGSGNTAASLQLTNLTASTTYYFQVAATNSAGTTKGSILSFTTTAPGKPIVITTTPVVQLSMVSLTGVVNPNGSTTTSTFEYSTDSTFTTGVITVASSPYTANQVYTNVYGLTGNQTYFYRVKAVNSYGTSYGNIIRFKTVFTYEGIFVTVKNGKWDDPTLWDNGHVPVATSQVIVKHGITITTNSSCYSLRLQFPGSIYLYSNTKLDILH
ncbi:MAG: glycine-rich protein [Bacteroidota bacterium]